MKVSVIGGAGYVGGELLRILLQHPDVRECTATSRSQDGRSLGEVHPGLSGLTDARFSGLSPARAATGRDVVFLALEHGQSSQVAAEIFERKPGLVIDLAADFRVQDLALYQQYYGSHPAPSLVSRFRYGLADIEGEKLKGATAIAIPGCFATGAQLALYPLGSITDAALAPAIFGLTGSSGSGVHPRATTHHPSRANNVFAYSLAGHRHEAEISAQWRSWTGRPDAKVRLLTHSGPFVRGIYLTLHARLHPRSGSPSDYRQRYVDAFAGRPFVYLTDKPPELTHVVGSNNAMIHVAQSADGEEITVCVAIDNLIKGAGGQAVQAMNLALGIAEDSGLRMGGMFPC